MFVSDIAARVGDALLRVRTDAGLVQEDMAIRLNPLLEPKEPISQTWVSRREKGIVEARPSEIDAWERATGTRPGTVYQLAGLIDPGTLTLAETRSVITHDPLLRRWQRVSVLALYEQFVRVNAGEDDA